MVVVKKTTRKSFAISVVVVESFGLHFLLLSKSDENDFPPDLYDPPIGLF